MATFALWVIETPCITGRVGICKNGLELDVDTSSCESVTLFKEEIDADLIPSDDLARLKIDPLNIIMTSFLDQKGNSYVFGQVADLFEEGNQCIEYAVCLKEGQLFEGNIN
jgi:hypothetical protein